MAEEAEAETEAETEATEGVVESNGAVAGELDPAEAEGVAAKVKADATDVVSESAFRDRSILGSLE